MMQFRLLKQSIIENVLGPAELGRFRTIGFQRQGIAAEEVIDNSRLVQVYYQEGEFKKSAGAQTGPTGHDITFRVESTVSKAAEGDLSALLDPNSTVSEKSTALLNFQEASALADESMDELFDILYQIFMYGPNLYLGRPANTVANRWVESMEKGNPIPKGELVILAGTLVLSCRVSEEVLGDIGVPNGEYGVNIIDINGDTEQKTEVAGTLGG